MPVAVKIEHLDGRYVGWICLDTLSECAPGSPPLVPAGAILTEGLIDRIRFNAPRLGCLAGGLSHIHLAATPEVAPPMPREVMNHAQRQRVRKGIVESFLSVKKRFGRILQRWHQEPTDRRGAVNQQIESLRLEVPEHFRKTIDQAVQDIVAKSDLPTLFACMEEQSQDLYEHSLRIFTMGIKLVGRLYQSMPAGARKKRLLANIGYGLLFHDIGMLFVPRCILEKTVRIPSDELHHIERELDAQGYDHKLFQTILAVNDPRYVYRKAHETRLKREVEDLRELVDTRVLRKEQFLALERFPERNCLDDDERRVMEKHPAWGWTIIRDSSISSPQALDIVRHHHQRLDLSGYPDLQLDMSELAQIAAAVDYFDELVGERPHSKAKAHDVAFGILDTITSSERGRVRQLDRRVYDLFCESVEKYPTGSFVKLKGGLYDGTIGQVVEYDPVYMNQPTIRVFRDEVGRRLKRPFVLDRRAYDGTFHILGLPFTKELSQTLLEGAPLAADTHRRLAS